MKEHQASVEQAISQERARIKQEMEHQTSKIEQVVAQEREFSQKAMQEQNLKIEHALSEERSIYQDALEQERKFNEDQYKQSKEELAKQIAGMNVQRLRDDVVKIENNIYPKFDRC